MIETTAEQKGLKASLSPVERKRKDIWWIAPDGSNSESVIEDMKASFLGQALPWFNRFTDLQQAFREIEKGHNCLDKYYKASHLAGGIGNAAKQQQYEQLYQKERERIRKLQAPGPVNP